MFQTFMDDVRAWVHRPFRADMDFISLFLAVGTVIVFAGLWTIILAKIRGAD